PDRKALLTFSSSKSIHSDRASLQGGGGKEKGAESIFSQSCEQEKIKQKVIF
ncbi:Uncharacterized protein APZ42_007313, partial [Daphnia magna]